MTRGGDDAYEIARYGQSDVAVAMIQIDEYCELVLLNMAQ